MVEGVVGVDGGETCEGGHGGEPIGGLLVAVGGEGVPIVFGHKVDGGGDGEVGGGVVGSPPLHDVDVATTVVGFGVVAPTPADDEWVDVVLVFAAGVEETHAFGGEHPFVAIACVEVGTDGSEVEGELAGGMCAVDEGEDAVCAGAFA